MEAEKEKEKIAENIIEEAKEAEKEALYRMIDEQLSVCRERDGLQHYLELLVRFSELTTENLLLLAKQAPKATLIGTAEDWFLSGNPVRKGGRSFRLVSATGEVERWYDLTQTMDVPKITAENRAEGILTSNALRQGDEGAGLHPSDKPKKGQDAAAIRELIVCLMCGAPCRFEVVEAAPWETRCTPYHPIDWQPGRQTLHILKGVDRSELLYHVALIRAVNAPAVEDQSEQQSEQLTDELMWLTAGLAAHVFCRRCGLELPPPDELALLPSRLGAMDEAALFCLLERIRNQAAQLQVTLNTNRQRRALCTDHETSA